MDEEKTQLTLGMKLKTKQIRIRTYEYWSTLIHELGHGLGMMHFPKEPFYEEEIMAVGRGGTLIPSVGVGLEDQPVTNEDELPKLKSSPFTINAFKWVYSQPHPDNVVPIYCNFCKVLNYVPKTGKKR